MMEQQCKGLKRCGQPCAANLRDEGGRMGGDRPDTEHQASSTVAEQLLAGLQSGTLARFSPSSHFSRKLRDLNIYVQSPDFCFVLFLILPPPPDFSLLAKN